MQSSHSSVFLQLASASPRRRELLQQLGLAHTCLPQDVDEGLLPGEMPIPYVQRLARDKVTAALADPGCDAALPVIAADTTVVCDGRILGKPVSLGDALGMLSLLSGRRHQVHTAVAVQCGERRQEALSSSTVQFRDITREEMLAYWHSGEPCDKAGAYAIQGRGAIFVRHIEGSYSNVVGLPLFETMELLAPHGITSSILLSGDKA